MSVPTIVVVDDEERLARSVAETFIGHARHAIAARGIFNVALAGGSTPKRAYALLAAPPFSMAIDWTLVRVYFGDERCVPPDSDRSNYRMAREAFAPLRLRPEHVHRIHGEDEPTEAARAYATLLRDHLGDEPTFDLVMLGMGPDGHTASLFPGADPYTDDESLVRAPFVPQFSTHRITLTPRVITRARAIAVATAGSAKAQALGAVFDRDRPPSPIEHPIVILRAADHITTWYVDRAAAAQLGRL